MRLSLGVVLIASAAAGDWCHFTVPCWSCLASAAADVMRWQVWDRDDCVTFIGTWLKNLLLKAQAEGRANVAEEAPRVTHADSACHLSAAATAEHYRLQPSIHPAT